jgi:hypothetical protein
MARPPYRSFIIRRFRSLAEVFQAFPMTVPPSQASFATRSRRSLRILHRAGVRVCIRASGHAGGHLSGPVIGLKPPIQPAEAARSRQAQPPHFPARPKRRTAGHAALDPARSFRRGSVPLAERSATSAAMPRFRCRILPVSDPRPIAARARNISTPPSLQVCFRMRVSQAETALTNVCARGHPSGHVFEYASGQPGRFSGSVRFRASPPDVVTPRHP